MSVTLTLSVRAALQCMLGLLEGVCHFYMLKQFDQSAIFLLKPQ